MTDKQELVCVAICQGWDLAQIYKSKLQAAGIPVLLTYDSASIVFGLTVDGLGQVRITVPQVYASKAKELLKSSNESQQDGLEDQREADDGP